MIDGTGELHWATLYDEDGEPYGETCRCSLNEDHDYDPVANDQQQATS